MTSSADVAQVEGIARLEFAKAFDKGIFKVRHDTMDTFCIAIGHR